MIINGVKEGRPLRGGKFDMDDVWSRRSVVLNDSDSIAARVFKAERDVDFCFIIAYEPDSVDENKLLFEMARYNFTNFLARNFDMEISDIDGIAQMNISGFRNYDEALQYARLLFNYDPVVSLLQKARTIIISKENLELLGKQYSYQEYDEFYEQHFIPLKVKTVQLLTEPSVVVYENVVEPEKKEPDANEEGDDLFNGGVIDDNTLMELDILPEVQSQELNTVEPEQTIPVEPEQPAIPVEETKPVAEEAPAEQNTFTISEGEAPAEEENTFTITEDETPADDNEFIITDDDSTATDDDNSFIITDDATDDTEDDLILAPDTPSTNEKPALEDDDEYFDFDGF